MCFKRGLSKDFPLLFVYMNYLLYLCIEQLKCNNMLVEFELDILKKATYGKLMLLKENLELLLDVQNKLYSSTVEENHVDLMASTIQTIKKVERNLELTDLALELKEQEVFIDSDILPIFLN